MRIDLPNEPRIRDLAKQTALTERFLLPVLAELESFFLALRLAIDPIQQKQQPRKLGKDYPLGQCLEITQQVQKLLPKVRVEMFEAAAARGFAAFSAFQSAGGVFRQVWGDLRGEFFQNAFLLGTLYIDVANDTVTVTKPKVEILPFAESGLSAVADFLHFERLAARYWKDRIVANHVLPALAPYFPLLHVNQWGRVVLRECSHYMITLARARQFTASEDVLARPPMPEDIFDHVTAVLSAQGLKTAASATAGRAAALQMCREYRRKRVYVRADHAWQTNRQATAVNNLLGTVPLAPELYQVSGG